MLAYSNESFFANNDYLAFKLRNLYSSNMNLFFQIVDFMPNLVYINKHKNLDYVFSNDYHSFKSVELDTLFEKGSRYLSAISCPILLNNAIVKVQSFSEEKDYLKICSYVQRIKMNSKLTYTYTSKVLLDDSLYLNISCKLSDYGSIGKKMEHVYNFLLKDSNTWLHFQSLTKREKLICKLLAIGKSNNYISEALFISIETVKTHRKKIYKKLGVNNIADLIYIAFILDIEC
jgi:DNA-binding CsgD family transcriptional regulator